MNLYIFKIHPDIEECGGIIVARAESYKQAHSLLLSLKNEDIFAEIENPKFGGKPFIYMPGESIFDHVPRNAYKKNSGFWQPVWCLVGEYTLLDIVGSEGKPIIFKEKVVHVAYYD